MSRSAGGIPGPVEGKELRRRHRVVGAAMRDADERGRSVQRKIHHPRIRSGTIAGEKIRHAHRRRRPEEDIAVGLLPDAEKGALGIVARLAHGGLETVPGREYGTDERYFGGDLGEREVRESCGC